MSLRPLLWSRGVCSPSLLLCSLSCQILPSLEELEGQKQIWPLEATFSVGTSQWA